MKFAKASWQQTAAIWMPLLFVPFAAWSKDATVVALFLGAIAILSSDDGRRAAFAGAARLSAFNAIAALMLIWSALSMTWALHVAALYWFETCLVVAMSTVIVRGVLGLSSEAVRGLENSAIVATVILFCILLMERVTGAFFIGLHRTLETTDRLFNVMSCGLAFLCCLTFPTAFLLAQRFRSWRLACIFYVASFLLAWSYHMDAAPLAIVLGGLVFTGIWVGGKHVLPALLGIGIAVALAWPSIANHALFYGWDQWVTSKFDVNYGLRVEIWSRVSTLIAEHPLIGHGFGTGRILGRPSVADIPAPVPFMHPHNGMLEMWLELGLVGVMLALGIAAMILRRVMALLSTSIVALAVVGATLACSSVFWFVSFGLWAGWWLAALGLTAGALALVVRSSTADWNTKSVE